MTRTAAIALATAAFMIGGPLSLASAHTAKYDSTVTIKLTKAGKEGGTISGDVESATARCVAQRGVNVRMRAEGPDPLVASAITDDAGAYELPITADLGAGDYYVVAAKKVLRKNSKHRHVCRRAVSENVTVK